VKSIRGIARMALALGCAACARAAVVIDFDSLKLPDYGVIPSDYGVTSDPSLADVRYRTFNASNGKTLTNYLEFWNSDYGDLSKIAFPSSNGGVGEITLVPAAGYGVRLLSFDMAGWPSADRSSSIMRILDGGGAVVFDYAANGPVTIQGDVNGLRHSTFTPNLFLPGSVTFQWGVDWDIGLDNFRFEVAAIPEPSTWLLLAGGAGVVLWRARRRFRGTGGAD